MQILFLNCCKNKPWLSVCLKMSTFISSGWAITDCDENLLFVFFFFDVDLLHLKYNHELKKDNFLVLSCFSI